jgi:hypothetical protein
MINMIFRKMNILTNIKIKKKTVARILREGNDTEVLTDAFTHSTVPDIKNQSYLCSRHESICGSGVTAPFILICGFRSECLVSFMS